MHTTLMPGSQADIEIGGRGVFLSRHAIEATIARGFTIDQVYDVLRNWENRYVQTKKYANTDDPGKVPFMYQKGQIGVAVVETPSCVLVKTVLLREQRQWSDEDARDRSSRTPL